ncbi:RING finger protein 37-like [Lytechinus pictus]|uniref:RING finger protein 37-like n=1 Tax=Lytechinus pictus TaxID=7653 RepID=UPI0030BA02F0
MAINFCSLAFGTKVACSSVSSDGYEVENLLKAGKYGQMKGFLAEYFIKPPVTITFTFPFKIDICSIIIDPNVGSQKSSGVEIFSATIPDGKESSGMQDEADRNGRSESFVVSTNIGKGYCNSAAPRLIYFSNRRYRPLHKLPTKSPDYQEGIGDVLVRDIRCSSPACVRNVNQIAIKITRVHGASVPALKKVEIWGQPAVSCEKPLIQNIIQTAEQLQGFGVKQKKPSTSTNSKKHQPSTSNVEKEGRPARDRKLPASDECPEDFVDPITCCIMAIPILLPSGHTVDQETLEKHKKIEATWGRPPNDPFTGLPFSAASKPIPNVKLKVRLDKFLLTGGAAFKNVPRTAGSASENNYDSEDSSKAKTSVLIQPKQEKSINNGLLNKTQVPVIDAPPSVGKEGKKHGRKRKRQDDGAETSYVNVQYANIAEKRSKAYGVHLSSKDMAWTRENEIQKDLGRHERAVSGSLDDALASTLASLPSYNKPSATSKDAAVQSSDDHCVNCQTSFLDLETNIYTMPCEHLICRSCTSTKTDGIDCCRCKRTYKTSQLSRVHKKIHSSSINVV